MSIIKNKILVSDWKNSRIPQPYEKFIFDYISNNIGIITNHQIKKSLVEAINAKSLIRDIKINNNKINQIISRTISGLKKHNPTLLFNIVTPLKFFHATHIYNMDLFENINFEFFLNNFKNLTIQHFTLIESENDKISDAIASATIEGSTINSILEYKQRNKHDIEKHEINNLKNAITYFSNSRQPLWHNLLKEMHKLLLNNLLKSSRFTGTNKDIGQYKTLRNFINTGYKPCEPFHVQSELEKLFDFFNERPINFSSALIKGWIIHGWFECIHPFTDGNGRLGRLIFEYYFYYHKFTDNISLSFNNIISKNKDKYNSGLQSIDKNFNYWINNTLLFFINKIKKLNI